MITRPIVETAARSLRACAASLALGSLALWGCGASVGDPGPSSETHWLKVCTADSDCALGQSCLCGQCTTACTSNRGCSQGTACVSPLSCAPAGACLFSCASVAGCASGLTCSEHACMPESSANSGSDGGDSAAPSSDAGGSGSASGPTACDPFQPTGDVVLGDVIAAGRAADGTIYLVDETRNAQHVYVSQEQEAVLYRQHTTGSGTSSDFLVFTVLDHDSEFTLQIDMTHGTPSAMGVFLGHLDTKTFTIGEQGEVLTMLPASEVTSMPARDLAAGNVIVYDTRLPDGRAFTVIRPDIQSWSYTDFRPFFGAQDRVTERPLRGAVAATMNGDATIPFDVDGELATARIVSLWSTLDGSMSMTTSGTIELGADTFPLTILPKSAAEGLSFFCLEP